MADYKLQHFVPRVYLKHFSEDGRNATPKSLIWRIDGKSAKRVPYVSECADDWHYGRDHSAKHERMFGRIESLYDRVLLALYSMKSLSHKRLNDLLLMMFDLHCRNPAYRNRTGNENFFAYSALSHCTRILLGETKADISNAALRVQLKERWKVEILRGPNGLPFNTSDNPSLWFTWDNGLKDPRLGFIFLPLNPHLVAIAFDKTFSRLTSRTITREDTVRLNFNQLWHCSRNVYGSTEPEPEELEICRTI